MSMIKHTADLDRISGRAVAVIGAGAAGMMAAIRAAEMGATVTVFERNDFPGKKLRITGKGRCNVTNDCDTEEFLKNVPTNPRFLYAALSMFGTQDTKSFFEKCGVPLKTERGKRVFPVSDRAIDIVRALSDYCRHVGVIFVFGESVKKILVSEGQISGIETENGRYPADAVIVATGGKSYPLTGSNGDGYQLARRLGHTVTELTPSLVPLVANGSLCATLQGLSLKNVSLKIQLTDGRQTVFEDFGEMMFTHFGLTGPLVLSASAHLKDMVTGKYEAVIDLKPALTEKVLDARILSDFSKYENRDLVNALKDLLPQKLILPIIRLSGIDERKKIHSITREERHALLTAMKQLRISIRGFRPIEEAIVTKGGVSVREVNPKTMQSKILPGLYFAGEILDLDAYTGGFNLQIAFSTGYVAGEHAAIGD